MSGRWLCWVALGLASACATDTKASKAEKPREQPSAVSEAPAEAEEAAESAEAEPKPSAGPQNVVASVSNPAEIDPERIPVEEDFVKAAESTITRRSNLEAELKRIASEIQSGHK